jgi:hypothetical protein
MKKKEGTKKPHTSYILGLISSLLSKRRRLRMSSDCWWHQTVMAADELPRSPEGKGKSTKQQTHKLLFLLGRLGMHHEVRGQNKDGLPVVKDGVEKVLIIFSKPGHDEIMHVFGA